MDPLFTFEKFDSNIALIDGDNDRSFTYKELINYREILKGKVETPRSLIFLFTQNYVPDVIAYLSLLDLGHVICLLDTHLDQHVKNDLINFYHPHLIIDTKEGEWRGYQSIEIPDFDLKFWKALDVGSSPTLHPDLQLLLSTSGTTGSPKMIRLSRKNILSNADSIIKYLEIGSNERAIASLPIHYSYGLSVLHTHILTGGTIVLTQKSVLQAEFWEVMKQQHCTSFAGVPYTYRMLDRIGFEKMELPSLKTMTQAGGHLEKGLVEKFHAIITKNEGKFFVMYGQTEATARIAYLPPDLLPEKSNAIGKVIPGGVLKIYEGSKEIFNPNQKGDLIYYGPNVMLGYANGPEDLSKGDENRGVLETGDLAYFDKDGIFYLAGRLKRISKVYGLRINLDELEEMVHNFGQAAATSDDNKIILFFEEGSKNLFDKCIHFLAEELKLHYTTFECRLIKRFPRTRSGKIDYSRL